MLPRPYASIEALSFFAFMISPYAKGGWVLLVQPV